MYVKVRTVDGKEETTIMVSKQTLVQDLKFEIVKELGIKKDLQRLFFRGKQLEDGYKLHHYNINLNDVIQLMKKAKIDNVENIATCSSGDNIEEERKISKNKEELVEELLEESIEAVSIEPLVEESKEEKLVEAESLYYKVGDAVDCLDREYGIWFEATVQKILKNEEEILYNVLWEFDNEAIPFNVDETCVRPRARCVIPFEELYIGQKIMINYNLDEPENIGLWYDFTISKINMKRKLKELSGILHMGGDHQIEIQKIKPKGKIYAIEVPKLLTERTAEDKKFMISNGERRPVAPSCPWCNDNPRRNCRECGCKICAGKQNEHLILMCDDCGDGYHLGCLIPPLITIPKETEWFCPECKTDETEIVKPGDKLKKSKKKSITQDSKKSKKDWGKGMACVGRTKICNIVSSNHRGPIPGIEVGMCWMFRLQVSEAGLHRPHIAGIHGRETDCAYSIVLSGGYENDYDHGDEFLYTGAGGRDLSGNKRTAQQSSDQTLTRMNKALALNCYATLNTEVGATAKDWKKGIPVRVVRSCKLGKYSKFAPSQGYRYDGIYKIVKYYPKIGKSGFRVWKYVLRRDDPSPAPWTKEGKARIDLLGLKLEYPDGYLEAMKKDRSSNEKETATTKEDQYPPKKKFKQESYNLSDELKSLIENDELNAKVWAECIAVLSNGRAAFLQYILDKFMCACCLDIVCKPVTISCTHNICLTCLKRSFSSGVYFCPSCRDYLGKDYKIKVNESLRSVLLHIYPGYEAGRN